HGYVFLCPTDATRLAPATPIVGYGRFRHEAACVDPSTFVAYLTEDQPDSALYRFVPSTKERPFEGRLQSLSVVGRPASDTSKEMNVARPVDVAWIDVDDPNPKDDTARHQARAKGAAILRRGEGIWLDGDDVFVCSTNGGPCSAGQIFRVSLGRGKM